MFNFINFIRKGGAFHGLLYSIIRVTLNTELDTLWLCRVCAKSTFLNLMKPFAHESPLTCSENDATCSLIVPLLDPEKLK